MKLTINHLAKIAHAELEFKGITIIAGVNNTGKSTAGKVLYAVFTALSNLSERVLSMREQKIREIVSRYVADRGFSAFGVFSKEIGDYVAKRTSDNDFKEQLNQIFDSYSVAKEDRHNCLNGIQEVQHIPDTTIETEVIENLFSLIFSEQYKPINKSNALSQVRLLVKGKTIDLTFDSNGLAYSSEVRLRNKALFVSDPNIVDALQPGRQNHFAYLWDPIRYDILRKVWDSVHENKENPDKGIIDSILNNDLLEKALPYLSIVVQGKLHYDRREGYLFASERLKADLNPKNLSMGLKAFVLLQFLIQNRVLNPKDVLILDEPEIHLHPEWQLKYAELVVLLQKHFDLTILLTSHSPYFIDAIRLYSKKHGISDKVNAYHSVLNDDEVVTMNSVKPDDWDELFAHFVPPIDELHALRNEYMKGK